MSSEYLWQFLLIGYPITIALETPVLFFGLSPCYSPRQKLFAGIWLTACTYPIVVLVLPSLMLPHVSRGWYLLVAEVFAPAAECILFRLAFPIGNLPKQQSWTRNFLVIIGANLFSYLTGEGIDALGGWGWIDQRLWGSPQ